MMKNEDPPNKEVHADDLAVALARLHARDARWNEPPTPEMMDMDGPVKNAAGRERSGSTTMIYHPQDHGNSPALPAISVEDTSDNEMEASPMEDIKRGVTITHTERPPVELMEH